MIIRTLINTGIGSGPYIKSVLFPALKGEEIVLRFSHVHRKEAPFQHAACFVGYKKVRVPESSMKKELERIGWAKNTGKDWGNMEEIEKKGQKGCRGYSMDTE